MWESLAKAQASRRVQSRHEQTALVHVKRGEGRKMEREEPGAAARREEQPRPLGWRAQGSEGGVSQP